MNIEKEKILKLKDELKDNLVIAAHHYQNEDIIDIADIVGDSYLLAKKVSQIDKKNIVLCGVKFMAETAKILAKDDQNVYIPQISALCPLADKANLSEVEDVYYFLKNEKNLDIVPVTYVNSYVDIKSFTGKNNGSCCTSSNAEKIIKYFLSKKKKILFLPDFYLGSNTSIKIGNIKVKPIFEDKKFSLRKEEDYSDVELFLWNGFCPIHQAYTESDIIRLRSMYPGIKIVVHPESKVEVVKLSDFSGSTEYIYNLIKESEKGSIWSVGTESTFVNRIAKENPDKKILHIKESYCKNMGKITKENLYNLLISIKDGKAQQNLIDIDEEFKKYSLISLENMISIVENKF